MNFKINDNEYLNIIKDIMKNKHFKKMKEIQHHGITRLDHCLKVSYYSYKIAKIMHLNYKETARGGLLHDFFFTPDEAKGEYRLKSFLSHPKKALETANANFKLSDREQDMIVSHMFPVYISIPKYMESWIISIVDKMVAISELSFKFKFKFRYTYNIVLLFIIGFIK